jgi:hypothetical protein
VKNADDNLAKQLTILSPPLPLPLSQPGSQTAAISRGGLPDRQAWSSNGSAPFEARGRSLKPVGSDEVAQWLRRARNLRRAIVVATILGPPSH